MKTIIALPDNDYFLWQMLVQMNNLKKFGMEEDVIYVIGKRNMSKSENLKNIIKKSGAKFSFYVINDERTNVKYSSSLRPHILKKLFKKYPSFEKETFFYIDPDVLLTKKIKFSDLEKNNTWYVSNTRSYIGVDYIKSKGDKLFLDMCKIVGIDHTIVEKNDKNAGGAQYLMKNVTWKFWEEVENKSEELFRFMVQTSDKYNPEHPIQAWTADMWAVLWLAWKHGHNVKILKRFDFSWGTDVINKWNERSIYHNAGVVSTDGTLFNKTQHQISPFNKDIDCSDKYCTYNYVKEIKETEKNFKNILF